MLEKRTALADAVAEVAEAVLPAASPVDMPNEGLLIVQQGSSVNRLQKPEFR